jgi:16S rRNA (guanine(527)-N(7))-methyltransferase RsmG
MSEQSREGRCATAQPRARTRTVRPADQQLLAYLDLIAKWNKVYNLTAVRPEEMLASICSTAWRRSAAASTAWRAAAKLLDVGSGAGLPGVVFAICCPELKVDCVDTVGKKAAFIQQAAAQLQLPNLRGVHDRVENLAALRRDQLPRLSPRCPISSAGRAGRLAERASGWP